MHPKCPEGRAKWRMGGATEAFRARRRAELSHAGWTAAVRVVRDASIGIRARSKGWGWKGSPLAGGVGGRPQAASLSWVQVTSWNVGTRCCES